MVRVKRPVLHDDPLELPSGGLNQGESPEEGALRELREETGIQIFDTNRLKPLTPISNSPNRNPYLIYTFAVELSVEEWEKRKSHDNEISSVEKFSLNEIISMLKAGEIYVALHIALISIYLIIKNKLSGRQNEK
jgi:ADP-ribose pyrophosphatase